MGSKRLCTRCDQRSEYASSTEPRTVVVCLDLKVEPYYRFAKFGIEELRYYGSYWELLNEITDRNRGRNTPPLFAINFAAGDSSLQQSNITNLVGTSWCPYVTAPVQTVTVDDIRASGMLLHNALMKDIRKTPRQRRMKREQFRGIVQHVVPHIEEPAERQSGCQSAEPDYIAHEPAQQT